MSRATPAIIGKSGEQIAVDFLRMKGYRIAVCNYRWKRGEIDIIAQKGQTVAFVEVKTARRLGFGPPETWVDERKQRQIGMVAEHYLSELQQENLDCRFDVIAVVMRQNTVKVRHLENAFWLE